MTPFYASMNEKTAVPNNRQWTIVNLIRWVTSYLKSHDIDSPRATGEILLAHALGLKRIDLYLKYDQPLVAHELQNFKTLIKRRVAREPVAYIVGFKEFWSLELEVNPHVLIPRPETECLVEAVLKRLVRKDIPASQRILELGTGSGAIVLALASQQSECTYFASDRFRPAIKLARRNARRHQLHQHINFFVGDWMSSLSPAGPGFDLIVSNPPYIPRGAIFHLQPEICRFEPVAALDGGNDGFGCHRKIMASAYRHLNPDGVLMLEIGHDQREGIRQIAAESDRYESFRCIKDYSGCDRVVSMRKRD
jgi:release factor glutamine methyltransferase